jgi:hypothetical protein
MFTISNSTLTKLSVKKAFVIYMKTHILLLITTQHEDDRANEDVILLIQCHKLVYHSND